MPDPNQSRYESSQIIYKLLTAYTIIDAVYHKDDNLIFRVIPKSAHVNWQASLKKSASEAGYSISFVSDQNSYLVIAKKVGPPKIKTPWLNIILFIATVASMVVFYCLIYLDKNILDNPAVLLEGAKYALALMPIILLHEFGHYVAGRWHKAKVSLPYFIPAPTPFGTLGAIIKSKSPMRNRRQLFDIGVSGPIAGFIPAIIIVIIGLSISSVEKLPELSMSGEYLSFGESLIMQVLRIAFAPPIPEGYTLTMNPVLFAGWVGMFITMINLMPFGQMDGGHLIYSMFGRKTQFYLALTSLLALLGLGIYWRGWLLWAVLALFVIKLKHPPTLDDTIKLTRTRKIIGWIAIVIFIVTFIPVPIDIVVMGVVGN